MPTLEPTNLPLASSPTSQRIKSSSELKNENLKSPCLDQSSLSSNSTTFGKLIKQLGTAARISESYYLFCYL